MFAWLKKEPTFHGGLKLDGHKLHGEAGKIRQAPLPKKVILPVSQHIGAPATPLVEVGDRVLRGQCIAQSDNFIAAPVHASISGTVTAIEKQEVPHPSGLQALAVVIESDGLDEALPEPEWPPCEDPFSLDADTLRQRVRAAGLVGLGGAAFPSAVKLNPGSSALVNTLILNGAECEPYISCDAALMTERAESVLQGAELIRRSLGAHECLIGIEDNAPDAERALKAAVQKLGLDSIQVRSLPTRYPQGGEKQLVQSLTGLQVPSEGLPLDIGIVVQNVGTAAAIWHAIHDARPLISRILTVNGPGISEPQNLEVRLGTPVEDLLEHCGGYSEQDSRLIMGGPMMGFALFSAAVPIVKATNCLLVETQEPPPPEDVMPCIRCGECVDACPASLLPQQLYWHARAKEFDKTQSLNLFDCIECGCCAQVCPSNIPLVQYYRYAKTEIYQAEQEKRKADIARNRHEFRQERQEKEAREKEEARRRKRDALKTKAAPDAESPAPSAKPKNDAIAAAVAKAKAEKAKRMADDASSDSKASAADLAAAAIAKAKAAKGSDGGAADAIAKAKAAKAQKTGGAADAIAKAKAAKAAKQDDANNPAAAAIAAAKAKKAAKAGAGNNPALDAIEKAKAAKAAKQGGDVAADDIAKAKAAKAAKSSDGANPALAAIEKAKAAKAAKQGGGAAADAIAKAKAAKAAKTTSSDKADNPALAAIEKAKAAKAAASPDSKGGSSAAADAIARAKAAKAKRESQE